MMNDIDAFQEVMQKRSDLELVEIVTTLREGYQHTAVEAANLELKKTEHFSRQN